MNSKSVKVIELSDGESYDGARADDDDDDYQPDPLSMDELEGSSQKPKSLRAKSLVWRHYDLVGEDRHPKCRHCKREFKTKHTSNLSRHLGQCKKLQAVTENECTEEVEVQKESVCNAADQPNPDNIPMVERPALNKKNPSWAWNHFTTTDEGHICKYCDRVITYNNTSNMKRHLLKKHKFSDATLSAKRHSGEESSTDLEETAQRQDSPISTDRDHAFISGCTDVRSSSHGLGSSEVYSHTRASALKRQTPGNRGYHPDDRQSSDYWHDYTPRLKTSRGLDPIPQLTDFLRFRSPRHKGPLSRGAVKPKKPTGSSVAKTDAASNAHYLLSLLPFMNSLDPQENMEIRIEIQNAFTRRLFSCKKPSAGAPETPHSKPAALPNEPGPVENDIVITTEDQNPVEPDHTGNNELHAESTPQSIVETIPEQEVTNEVVFSQNSENNIMELLPQNQLETVNPDHFSYV